ncbi:MAG: carboxypeptidase-like regulatory domain-containing protein [Candidatus Thermoplasmatota archaeon]|nr:carboxypeptidase-like regulatory domain-containing protein [Candidatus Thermoplasmatota archaeon]
MKANISLTGDDMRIAKTAIVLAMALIVSGSMISLAVGEASEPNVNGHVLDAASGEGIPALVTFYLSDGNSKIEVRSDDDGYFALFLREGEYRYTVESRGYESYKASVKVGASSLTMRAPMKASADKPVDNLYGSVHDAESGSPLYAVIAIHLPDSIEPLMKLETDRSGQFSALLRPGEYRYHAESRDHESVKGRFSIPEEGVVKLPIKMSPMNGDMDHGIVHGIVLTGGERPVPGCEVLIFPLLIDGHHNEKGPAPMSERTDEHGEVHMRVPFGAYHVEVHREGFVPGFAEFEVTAERPEAHFKIFIAPVEAPEPPPGHGIRIEFERIDRDSDGNPERVFMMVQMDMDPEPEVLYEIMDRDSDGNPEVVTFTMNVEPRLQALILMLIDVYLREVPPFPDMPLDEQLPGGDMPFLERIEDYLNSDPANVSPEEEPGMGSEEKAQEAVSQKTSRQDISGRLILGIGAVLVLMGLLGIAAFIAVRRKDG